MSLFYQTQEALIPPSFCWITERLCTVILFITASGIDDHILFRLYCIVTPSLLSPGHPLHVDLHLLRAPRAGGRVMVTASLMRGQNSLTSLTRDLLPLAPVSLELEVPSRLQGEYRLEVRGVDLTSMEGDLFQHSVPLTVTKPSQLVGLRLDQNIFLPSQNVAFVVWVAQTNLSPYTGSIDIELVGPGGAVMQRWSHRGAGVH